ncbi:MAG TPA: transglycosylase domain-containing protein [Mycobacteriales bacterium]|nr:transglycosylase domain-containing protein [Mycobacteriales bacterium]
MSSRSRVPRRGPVAVLTTVGLGVLVSFLCGAVLAALALPVVGGVALSTKAAADTYLALPAELDTPPPAQRSRILAADGSLLATLYLENRVSVPLRIVSQGTRKAVIAIEDSRFYAHTGVDVKGTLRAAITNSRAGGIKQGGSTLTQQYVKNALLYAASDRAGQEAATEASLDRKLREARFAISIERTLTKDEILERYLNIAYFGNGVYGIGTAANFYFAKPVNRLTLAESALLAGVVQNPGRLDPVLAMKDPEVRALVLARRAAVLDRMATLGFITRVQEAKAGAEPLRVLKRTVGNGCGDPAVTAPFFCDYLRRILEEDSDLGRVLGATKQARQAALLAGGLTIHTTLDPRIQRAAQTAVNAAVPQKDPSGTASAVDVVEPGTGNVRAMAVNRTYGKKPGQTEVNYAIGGSGGFQGGSTFKVFVLARALQAGIPLSLSLFSPETYRSKIYDECAGCGPYTPSNAGDSHAGVFDLVTATHDSVNTYYVQLEERTGVEQAAGLAESMGVKQFAGGRPAAPLNRGGAFVLGGNEVSPLAMAAAYGTFAARGLYCSPRAVTKIVDSRGVELPVPGPKCAQVVEQGVADTVTSVLRGVIDGTTPGRTGRSASIGRPAAGKTGTTNGSRAAWFVGYTPELSTAVWLGKPARGTGRPEEMRNLSINGRYYRNVYGGTVPAGIWREVMSSVLHGTPVRTFPDADIAVSQGAQVGLPDVAGFSRGEAERTLLEAGFGVRTTRVAAAPVPAGRVAYTFPKAGRLVTAGTTVTLYVSDGRTPQPSPAPSGGPGASGRPSEPPQPQQPYQATSGPTTGPR